MTCWAAGVMGTAPTAGDQHLTSHMSLRSIICPQVGFATAYRLWRFPETARLRLSQVLVLPPFQRRNVGTQLMHAAYACARRHGAADLTVSCLCQTASLCEGPVVAMHSVNAGLPQANASELTMRCWGPCESSLRLPSPCMPPLPHRAPDWAVDVLLQQRFTCQRGPG